MKRFLVLSIRFLDDRYHGQTDHGEKAEWPPSPFRLFQAIVAGNARGAGLPDAINAGLDWLESLAPPLIVAPHATEGMERLTYVINNYSHKNAKSRAPKTIRPTLLNGDRLVQYAWSFDADATDAMKNAETIISAAKRIRCLGWGIDMAVGTGSISGTMPAATVSRRVFRPGLSEDSQGVTLRTPTVGSLLSLERTYAGFINRFETPEVTRIEAAEALYRPVKYVPDSSRPHAIFKLIDDNEDTFRYSHARLIHIAGMVRHLAIKEMDAENGNPPPWIENPVEWVNRVVRGKRDDSAGNGHKQFSYVPLPSIGHAHADAMIRNVMIVAPLGMERELNYLAERLDGLALNPKGNADSCATDSTPSVSGRVELQKFTPPRGKFIAECYLGTSSVWETVTPVILDGCNRKSKSDKPDAIARATEKLICKALARAGIEAPCDFTWQLLPFVKNALSAHKYDAQGRPTGYFRPSYLQGYTAVHLRIRFGHPVPGPIMVGAGRHCGLGTFSALIERPS